MSANLLHHQLFRAARVLFTPGVYLSTGLGNDLGLVDGQKEIVERTITEEDVNLFSKVTCDFNVIHFNTNERRGIVHGALLNGIVSGVIGTKLPGNGTIVLSQTLNFPKPCYVGDTVVVTVEIENVRKILTCKYQIVNKITKAIVMEGSAKLLVRTDSRVLTS